MSLGVLAQDLSPAVRRGEAATLTVTGSFATTPAAWAVAFKLRLHPGGDWTSVTSGITASVTGSGPFAATWSVPLTAAQTAALAGGLHEWRFERTDAGSETVLAAGTVLVV